jgi:formylmethanofuran dehydrogenase subunit B
MEHVLLSMCCDAAVLTKGRTTRYYVCTACGEPCDAYQVEKSVDDAPADKMIRRGGKVRKKAF